MPLLLTESHSRILLESGMGVLQIEFTAADFAARWRAKFVGSWRSNAASNPSALNDPTKNGVLYAWSQGIGAGLVDCWVELEDCRRQTRIASSGSSALDTRAQDYFLGVLQRLANESDGSYATRIRTEAALVGTSCIGMQTSVAAYLTAQTTVPGQTKPQVIVYDQATSPIRWALMVAAGFVNTTSLQFIVELVYPAVSLNGFYLGYSYLDYTADLSAPGSYLYSPANIDQYIVNLIKKNKSPGTNPIYVVTLTTTSGAQLLGLDTSGGLDVSGGFDAGLS